ncbi:hypothetical protein OIK40_14455 [Erythrobacter sp. sf7]|uniref:Lipoprotein n=1 Tax=Erythrobacter fulvus TaxID=2987523 RepID=A0ABT5JWD4_9SPHN|nr:hypothetical protein [Erythrobacter fulvus]MDC8755847.1 hypothetical protein [Erythrobacter fulvus]
MKNVSKILAALCFMASVGACDSTTHQSTPQPQSKQILLYCDARSDQPVNELFDDFGGEFAGFITYRGFYRINLTAETLEAKLSGWDDFEPLCSPDASSCKLISNRSEIRLEHHGRRWNEKVINETYLFERNTGYFNLMTESEGPNGKENYYVSGSCRSVNSIDQQLF